MGIDNKFLFVYNKTSLKKISNLLFQNSSYRKEFDVCDNNEFIDFDCLQRLPLAIIFLSDESFYSIEYYPFDNGDGWGYISHKIKDDKIRLLAV